MRLSLSLILAPLSVTRAQYVQYTTFRITATSLNISQGMCSIYSHTRRWVRNGFEPLGGWQRSREQSDTICSRAAAGEFWVYTAQLRIPFVAWVLTSTRDPRRIKIRTVCRWWVRSRFRSRVGMLAMVFSRFLICRWTFLEGW